jgi:hypothetical protein
MPASTATLIPHEQIFWFPRNPLLVIGLFVFRFAESDGSPATVSFFF